MPIHATRSAKSETDCRNAKFARIVNANRKENGRRKIEKINSAVLNIIKRESIKAEIIQDNEMS